MDLDLWWNPGRVCSKSASMALCRELFPVTAGSVFLNNAAESPLNTRTHERTSEYLAAVLESPQSKPPHAAVRQRVPFTSDPDIPPN